MILKEGDKVEHKDYGTGKLIRAHDFDGDCIVEFDNPNKFGRTTLTVHESLLHKIE